MGIDKSDIQSVIHYDMPKSVENYVQEIGRAGRDGKLARCHMFLHNEDFFLIRRLVLADVLDHYNALKLTNKIIVESKRALARVMFPDLGATKKRKIKAVSQDEDDYVHKLIDEFEHEDHLRPFYAPVNGLPFIQLSQFDELEGRDYMHLFIDVKELTTSLDLKREVIMTMLNSLEKLGDNKRFFKFEGVLPSSVGVRFHRSKPQELAEKEPFIKSYLKHAKEHQGVYRCSIGQIALELDISPFHIPKILYGLQSRSDEEITYETDNESFVLRI